MLNAMCMPHAQLKEEQDQANWTKVMVDQEKIKMMPFGDVWAEYCRQCGTDDDAWFDEVLRYEKAVLSRR